MPIYEYKAVGEGCEHCSGGFEAFQKLGDLPLERCPRCGARVEKVLPSFQTTKFGEPSARDLKEHGFSRFRKTQDGNYEKEA